MAENLVMATEVTPKKVLINKPYSQEEKLKREEEELKKLKAEQKGEGKEKEEVKDPEPESAEEKTFKKRYGDLRRHTQQKERDLQKQIDELKNQLTDTAKKEMKLPKSDEDIEQWAKDYPDVAAIVETIAMKKAKEQSSILEKRIKEIDEMSADAIRDKAEAELLKIHPDFGEIRDSDDFHEWADSQPKWVQDALYENTEDARSAARAIDLYKSDKKINSEEKSKSKNDAAKAVTTKHTKSEPQINDDKSLIKESDVQRMSANEYEKKSEIIMEAIRSGNFVYDVSGSAR